MFLTNFLPDARERLRIDLDDIRAVNPDIIYVRGTAFGARGPEATRGGYDATAYWARGGHAAGVQPPDYDGVLGMPGPAYGDSLGGMTIAGGIAAALLARDRTGEPSVLDVSLLGLGLWANALAVDISLANGEPWPGRIDGEPARGADQPRGRTRPHLRRPVPLPGDDPGLEVLGRLLPPPRPRGHDRRRALEHAGEAAGQRAGRGRDRARR